jgi:glutamine amidotransferase
VGELSTANTHPFRRGNWVFAHNGTVRNVAAVRARTSARRLLELEGDTDSELFFAYLMSRLDDAGLADAPIGPATDAVVREAVLEAVALEDFGTLDALLSNGASLYAMRFGRPLFLLERHPLTAVSSSKEAGEVPIARRHCVVVASEPLTDEPWESLESGSLLRIDPAPEPSVTKVV